VASFFLAHPVGVNIRPGIAVFSTQCNVVIIRTLTSGDEVVNASKTPVSGSTSVTSLTADWWLTGTLSGDRITGTTVRAETVTVTHIYRTRIHNKPVGDCISAPSPNFAAMATRDGPTTFCMVSLNRLSRKPSGRPKHLPSICHTRRLIGDFVQIWGSKFWALGGLNQKSKNNVL